MSEYLFFIFMVCSGLSFAYSLLNFEFNLGVLVKFSVFLGSTYYFAYSL